jgi:hypothetical protein
MQEVNGPKFPVNYQTTPDPIITTKPDSSVRSLEPSFVISRSRYRVCPSSALIDQRGQEKDQSSTETRSRCHALNPISHKASGSQSSSSTITRSIMQTRRRRAHKDKLVSPRKATSLFRRLGYAFTPQLLRSKLYPDRNAHPPRLHLTSWMDDLRGWQPAQSAPVTFLPPSSI